MCSKNNCNALGCLAIVAGIVIGAILGFLLSTEVITLTAPLLFAVIVIALLAFILLIYGLISASIHQSCILSRAFCNNGLCLLFGIFGTLASAIALLFLGITAITTAAIVFFAIGAFFFTLLILCVINIVVEILCELC